MGGIKELVTLYYNNPAQRAKHISDQQALGNVLLNDDFVNNKNQATNGRSGKLTFETTDPRTHPARRNLTLNAALKELLKHSDIDASDIDSKIPVGAGK